ncbi:MAG TPA: hypothetical protein VGF61_04845 [Candidatus Acidoferrum sp.]
MDHLEAKRLHAAEKYVLGELTPDLRDAYEEHYFDCAECADDVQATLTFVSAGREVSREEPVPVAVAPIHPAPRSRWTSWFRPMIAIPAMGVLLLAVGYYSRTSKPQIGVITAPGQTILSSPSFGLRGGDRLENEKTIVQVPANGSVQLHFDFVPSQVQNFSSYTGELQDSASRVLLLFNVPPDRVNKEVNLIVPSGLLHPGDYTLTVFGHDASSAAKIPVAQFSFAVQNNP